MKPKVSVIVPVYNVENYLEICLDSLKSQTFQDIEFIIINDGSTDKSGEILHKNIDGDMRFRIIEQKNRGFAGARNRGLDEATGDYICFVDSDDWVSPQMFEKLVACAEAADADLASCSYNHQYDNDVVLPHDNRAQIRLIERSEGKFHGAEELLLDDGTIWNRIYRRTMIEENEIRFDERMSFGEDVYFYWTALSCSRKIAAIPDCLYQYRRKRTGSQTNSSDRRIFSYFTTCAAFDEFIKRHHLVGLQPWSNHLKISYLCFGYVRLTPELKQEYFEKLSEFLIESGLKYKEQIAVADAPGGLFHQLRYFVLKYLHPITLKVILSGNRKMFDRIILFREFLGAMPLSLAKFKKKIVF